MYELIALSLGVVLGIASVRLSAQAGTALVLGGALLGGSLVSWWSGELGVSWAFLVFDVAQVAVAAVCTAMFLGVRSRRRVRS